MVFIKVPFDFLNLLSFCRESDTFVYKDKNLIFYQRGFKVGRRREVSKVPTAFISYFNTIKVMCGYGALKRWADFCGCSPAWLTRLASGNHQIPIDIAIKTAIYSRGKVDLVDLCPNLKEDIAIIARQQILRESKANKGQEIDLSIHYKNYAFDGLTPKKISEFFIPFKLPKLSDREEEEGDSDESGNAS